MSAGGRPTLDSRAKSRSTICAHVRPLSALLFALVSSTAAGTVSAQVPRDDVGWRLDLGLGETWDSNLTLLDDADSDSFVHRVGATVGFKRASPRFSVDLSGQGGGVFYQSARKDDRLSYSLSGDLEWHPSRRTHVTMVHSQRFGVSQEIPFLVEEGQPIPQTRTRSSETNARVIRDLAPSTTLSARARRVSVAFDDESLVDGSVVSAGLQLLKELAATDTVGVEYWWQRSDRASRAGAGHTLRGSWRREINRAWSADLALGVLRFDPQDLETSSDTHAVGGITLARRLRKGTLDGRYTRFLTQAFGTGVDRLADLYSLGFTKEVARDLIARGSVTFTSGGDPEKAHPPFRTQVHTLTVARQLGRVTRLEVRYRYEWRRPQGGDAIRRHAVYVGITSGWRWR